jgi:hypothetical protein
MSTVFDKKLTPANAIEHASALVAVQTERDIDEYLAQLDKDMQKAERELEEARLMRGAILLVRALGRKVA